MGASRHSRKGAPLTALAQVSPEKCPGIKREMLAPALGAGASLEHTGLFVPANDLSLLLLPAGLGLG